MESHITPDALEQLLERFLREVPFGDSRDLALYMFNHGYEQSDKERRVIPDDLAVRLQSKADVMPTCMDYKRLLELAAKRTTIPMEVLRSAFGLYTYAQWAAVFNL